VSNRLAMRGFDKNKNKKKKLGSFSFLKIETL
jgi:hypothetical protein